MIKFDRLKIVAPIESVVVVMNDKFKEEYHNGILYSMKYRQVIPYKLSIEVNYGKKEAVIEFTGKILGKKYPELISVDTIQECFQTINAIGICSIDTSAIMDAEVVSCDITKDIVLPNYLNYMKFINGNISNFQAYTTKLLRTGSLSIEKNVVSTKFKKRLSIYNKEKEMSISNNQKFVSANGLAGKFEDKCRFELNLKCKEQIRDALHIADTKLRSVLSSTATPINDFINEIIADDPDKKSSSEGWKDYWQSLVLKDCGYDLGKVEAKLRQYKNSRSQSISKAMIPYRELAATINKGASTLSKDELMRLLSVSD